MVATLGDVEQSLKENGSTTKCPQLVVIYIVPVTASIFPVWLIPSFHSGGKYDT